MLILVSIGMLRLKYLVKTSSKEVQSNFGNMTLFVIAHPDDETMFFGPTIMNILAHKKHLIILCLSNGGADDLATVRKQELNYVVQSLGPRVTSHLIEDDRLKDGMSVEWNPEIVKEHIEDYIKSRNFPIQTIVTFDSYGVSGHQNHRSINKASNLLREQAKDLNINYLFLKSVSLWRKYLSFFDTTMVDICDSLFSESRNSDAILAIGFEKSASLRRILGLHRSQMVWFRQLYMLFSRYMFINNLSSF